MTKFIKHKRKLNEIDWVTASHWKRSAEEFVNTGDVLKLTYAFTWSQSPQGEAYWTNIYAGESINYEKAKEYVQWLLTPEVSDDETVL